MTPAVIGAGAGLVAGIGLVAMFCAYRATRMTLERRLAPIVDVSARIVAQDGRSALRVLIATAAGDLGRLVAFAGSANREVRSRLRTLGRDENVAHFRIEQLAWAALGLVVAIAALPLLVWAQVPLLAIVVLCAVAMVAAALGRDYLLSFQVRRYQRRVTAQLPDVAELFALAVSAGEGPVGALTRVTSRGESELADRLRRTLWAVRSGKNLATALTDVAEQCAVAPLQRFTDAVATALERGTPLAGVLRDLAQDMRAEQREALMESGGKREIGMLVPVVFFIMPLSIVFALYPSLHALQVVMP